MTIVPRNLETLDYAALDKIEAQIKTRKAQLFVEAEAKARRVLDQIGQAVGAKFEFVPPVMPATNGNGAHKAKAMRKPRKAKIAIKYRNPTNPAETWSGRGRPARWLAALEKQGKRREDFAVR